MIRKYFILFVLFLSACVTGSYRIPVDLLDTTFSDTGVSVVHETQSHTYRLLFPKSATFKAQSAVLSPQLMIFLDRLSKLLKRYPVTSIAVHGYSDPKGDHQANQALSERRAHAVISYMESQGISPNRLITHSHGEQCPKYFGKERYLNRRVEISIHYKDGSPYKDGCR